MHRFFALRAGDGHVILPPEEENHALRVLRMQPGDACQALLDGAVYAAEIMEVSPRVTLRLGDEQPSPEPRVRVTLYQGIPKGDKMDYIVQKCTEAGIKRITPVAFSRCVAEWQKKDAEKKLSRLRRIAAEAAKQSGRAMVPDVTEPMSFPALCRRLPEHELSLVPWEEQKGNGISSRWQGQGDVALVIGPEGGITAEEIGLLKEAGGVPVTLGPRIFRTETAGLAALISLLTLSGDMG